MVNTLPFVHEWLNEISEYNINCDHSHTSNTETLYGPPNNYQEHAAILNMKDSLIADSNTDHLKANKWATTLKLPANKIQTLCSAANETCPTCTEGIQNWDSSCKLNASFTCLMWELTSDPMKSAQLDALPVTSLNSYRDFIRQRQNVSSTARENMLKVVDTLAEIKKRNQPFCSSSVDLKQPHGDSTILVTSPVLGSGRQYLELKNSRKSSMFVAVTENKCTFGNDEIDYVLKSNSSQVCTQNTMKLEANYPPKQSNSSLTCVDLSEHNKENQPQLRSDLSNCFVHTDKPHAHQKLVDEGETSAPIIYLNNLNNQALLCVDRNESTILQPIDNYKLLGKQTNKENLYQELIGMPSGKEFNVEYYSSSGITENVKNKLPFYSSRHLERVSSGESSIQVDYMSSGKFQSTTGTEYELEQEFLCHICSQNIPCSSTNLFEVGNTFVNEEEESEEELDEEPLSPQTSSSSIQSLECSIHEINSPTFPQHITKYELDGGSAQFEFEDMSNSSVKHLQSSSLLEHSLGKAKNNSDCSDGSLVIRYNKKRKLHSYTCIGPGSYQQQVKIPSLVEICMEKALAASPPTKILDSDLSLVAQNVHSAMKDLLDGPNVTEHKTQSQYGSTSNYINARDYIDNDNMTNTTFPGNYSRSPDKFSRDKDSINNSVCEQASSAAFFENIPKALCSCQECENQYSFSSTQSSVHSLVEVASQHIPMDIITSLEIVE